VGDGFVLVGFGGFGLFEGFGGFEDVVAFGGFVSSLFFGFAAGVPDCFGLDVFAAGRWESSAPSTTSGVAGSPASVVGWSDGATTDVRGRSDVLVACCMTAPVSRPMAVAAARPPRTTDRGRWARRGGMRAELLRRIDRPLYAHGPRALTTCLPVALASEK
jgi:hypothetical protein